MKKKLFTDLKILAQEILSLDEPEEVSQLREKTQAIYDQLIIINYLNENPEPTDETEVIIEQFSKETELDKVDDATNSSFVFEEEKQDDTLKAEDKTESNYEEAVENEVIVEEQPIDSEDLFVPTFDSIKDDFSQKEEFKDTISLDETEKLFATKKEPAKQISLNDKLLNNSIQVGLNDRIAFVNHLFNFSQLEFNKVLSTLNDIENETEAKSYIQNTLKTKYNWTGKEEIEERFVLLVERKFL